MILEANQGFSCSLCLPLLNEDGSFVGTFGINMFHLCLPLMNQSGTSYTCTFF